jgi:alkyldihydroxyacetonephosphate synthase
VGQAQPVLSASFEDVLRAVPDSPLPDHRLISIDPADRLRHARGQSLPDWVALRTGRIEAFPAGVAYPQSEEDLHSLFQLARRSSASLIPYGGGTSVVGHINPDPSEPPAITVDLSRMSTLLGFDESSQMATFGAGIRGPLIEAALRARGYTLGHYPQSWELSTLGGWIATRSSGQQSLHYGRIEQMLAGGRLVTPVGLIEMPPHPASAAGPDLRHLMLGSEGRLGIISEATVRVAQLPELEEFHALFFKSWDEGVEAVREMAQARLPLSMLRLSTAAETEATLVMAGHGQQVQWLHRALAALGYHREQKCMLVMAITGREDSVRMAKRAAVSIARKHGALHTGTTMGRQWARSRFLSPYLRNSLWDLGYAVDTVETAVPWTEVRHTANSIPSAIREAVSGSGERAHVFSHLSHLYETGASIYTTVLFRVLPNPDQMLDLWAAMKLAASEAIMRCGGTISHQHGVGVDHAPYLGAEKGMLGMSLLSKALSLCDPDGIMNPGKLIDTRRGRMPLAAGLTAKGGDLAQG